MLENVTVVDAMCGCGKTYHAIKTMCESKDKYIFITPFLTEIDRVISESKSKYNVDFYAPEKGYSVDEKRGYGKKEAFLKLIKSGVNIATTHNLFSDLDIEAIDTISKAGYNMILDEVMEVIKDVKCVNDQDLKMLVNAGYVIEGENDELVDIGKDESGREYNGMFNGATELTKILKTRNVYKYSDGIYIWILPIELVKSVKSMTILTYMIEGQDMYAYLVTNGLTFTKMTCTREEGFVPFYEQSTKNWADIITIVDNAYYNNDSQKPTDYSSTYWKKASKDTLKQEKSALVSFFINYTKTKSDENMWTVYKGSPLSDKETLTETKEESINENGEKVITVTKTYKTEKIGKLQESLQGKGYTKGFVSCTARATNAFAHKTALAYLCNIYSNPVIVNHLAKRGYECDQDAFALSEMIQWIFRSQIRNSKPITIYVRSKRMRRLLKEWMNYE